MFVAMAASLAACCLPPSVAASELGELVEGLRSLPRAGLCVCKQLPPFQQKSEAGRVPRTHVCCHRLPAWLPAAERQTARIAPDFVGDVRAWLRWHCQFAITPDTYRGMDSCLCILLSECLIWLT